MENGIKGEKGEPATIVSYENWPEKSRRKL